MKARYLTWEEKNGKRYSMKILREYSSGGLLLENDLGDPVGISKSELQEIIYKIIIKG